MTDLRGRTFSNLVAGLNAGQHLAVDAVVAFVDGELDAGARHRAAEHLTVCQICATEVAGQRQARGVVRSAGNPQVPADLLAALRDIPQTADLPAAPDGLAVAEDGTIVAVADPSRNPGRPLGTAAPLGASPRWGIGHSVLGRRIGRTGAGAVVSGLVLGALIMTTLENPATGAAVPQAEGPPVPVAPAPVAPAPLAPAPGPPVPSVVPVAAPVAQPGGGTAGQTTLLRMTTQPGWHSLRLPR